MLSKVSVHRFLSLLGLICVGSTGHRRLTELGFLHGDVSAGNILLAIDPIAQGHAGFLVDFEFLKEYPKQTQFVGTVEVQPHFSWPSLS